MNIVTYFDPPPIPAREFDWRAIDCDSFDAEIDERGIAVSSSPIGYGRTEQEAVADLVAQFDWSIPGGARPGAAAPGVAKQGNARVDWSISRLGRATRGRAQLGQAVHGKARQGD